MLLRRGRVVPARMEGKVDVICHLQMQSQLMKKEGW
jgi:hypothetical protein